MFQGPWHGKHNAHEHDDDGKDDSALRVVRKGIEDLRAGQDMEANEEDIVGEQHEAAEFVCYLALSKCIRSEITCCPQSSIS